MTEWASCSNARETAKPKTSSGVPAEDAGAALFQQSIARSPRGDEFRGVVQLKQEFTKLTDEGDELGMLI